MSEHEEDLHMQSMFYTRNNKLQLPQLYHYIPSSVEPLFNTKCHKLLFKWGIETLFAEISKDKFGDEKKKKIVFWNLSQFSMPLVHVDALKQ